MCVSLQVMGTLLGRSICALSARLRGVLDNIAGGKAEANDFTEERWKDLSPDIKQMGEQFKEWGALKSFELMERKQEESLRILRYRAHHENGLTLMYTFRLTKENKIADIGLGLDE